jgi:peptide/nickel transport system substrate-binding protein
MVASSRESRIQWIMSQKQDRREFVTRTAGLAAALPFAGAMIGQSVAAAAPRAQDDPKPGGSLTIAVASSPISWDLKSSNWDNNYAIKDNLYDPLFVLNELEEPQPWLAESWTVSDDGLTYEFKLRQGVLFHDGTPLNAEAIKFTIEYYLADPAAVAFYGFTEIENVTAVDESTVQISLSVPTFPMIFRLGSLPALSPTAIEAAGDAYASSPVGTGPFKFNSFEPDSQIVYERNETYWNGPPPLEELIVRIIPEAEVQVIELQAGTIDVVFLPPNKDVQGLQDQGLTITKTVTPSIEFVSLNCAFGFTQELAVRKAIARAIDRDTIIEQTQYGLVEKSRAGNAPISPYYDETVPEITYDPDAAMQLLEEAGWVLGDGDIRTKDGEELKLIMVNTEYLDWGQLNLIIQDQLKKVGIACEIETLEYGAYLDRWRDTDTWNITYHDQGFPRHTDAAIPAAVDPDHYWNVNHIDNSTDPELMAVADKMRELYKTFNGSLDPVERKAAAVQIQQIVYDNQLSFWLFHKIWVYVLQADVKDYRIESSIVKFDSVWLDN